MILRIWCVDEDDQQWTDINGWKGSDGWMLMGVELKLMDVGSNCDGR
jgi:hypothetical protein